MKDYCIQCRQLRKHHAKGLCRQCYQKQYRNSHQKHIKQQKLQWFKDHKELIVERARKQYQENPKKRQLACKRYQSLHKDKIREYETTYERERKKYDVQFKLIKDIRKRINIAIKNNQKAGSVLRDLGCSISELKSHIESLWQPGMTWQNRGKGDGKWQLDHVIRLANFTLSDREQFRKAVHYTNLQPLWDQDHLVKTRQEAMIAQPEDDNV